MYTGSGYVPYVQSMITLLYSLALLLNIWELQVSVDVYLAIVVMFCLHVFAWRPAHPFTVQGKGPYKGIRVGSEKRSKE